MYKNGVVLTAVTPPPTQHVEQEGKLQLRGETLQYLPTIVKSI